MKKMKTTRYELNIIRPDLAPGTMRLAFLTDLHNAENGAENSNLIEAIKEAEPDIILCGGDMVVAHENTPITAARDLLLKLADEYPVYHALGNHESRLSSYPHQYGSMFEDYTKPLKDAGVVFLDNDHEVLAIKGKPVRLAGFTLQKKYYHRLKSPQLDASEIMEELGSPDPKALNILMAHHPNYMNAYTNWGADLTLCGHYHGGMVRFGKNTGLITPNLKFFNDRCCGHFTFHARITNGKVTSYDSHVIVGAGLGEHTLPIRFHNPRELVIVDINVSRE